MGGAEFCEILARKAPDSVVGQWILSDAEDLAFPPSLPRCADVVVDARWLTILRESAPFVFELGRSTRVAPFGLVERGLLTEPLTLPTRVFKRTLDLFLATTLLLVLLPVLLVAALAIKLDSPGPILFRQPRLGAGGRRFSCLKLRTMVMSDDDDNHRSYVRAMIRSAAPPVEGLFKLRTNPRITRVGRFLRRYSIDEAPQLWNVLRGDMSVVGPRPPVLLEAEAYGDVDWQRLRVKPGLTGLAQIRGRSGLRFDQIVAADVEYADSWSLWLELKILFFTPFAVVSGRGAA
ncbi:MAG: sugar transferase [Actinomycetota bacterium]|nr:sugar transferase [Actinomycetota bacterium]